ncbi:MAG: rod shape-determining protein MreD [Pseudomonadota bacterium]
MERQPTIAAILWPLLTGAAAIFLALAPLSGAAPGLQAPHWLLLALLFWAARRPWTTPPMLVFVLGLVFDLLRDGPIGAELFAMLLMVEAIRGWRARQAPFRFVTEWMRFCLAVFGFELVLFGLLTATYAPTPAIGLVLERMLVTMAAYPLAAYALQRLSGARLDERRFTHLTR